MFEFVFIFSISAYFFVSNFPPPHDERAVIPKSNFVESVSIGFCHTTGFFCVVLWAFDRSRTVKGHHFVMCFMFWELTHTPDWELAPSAVGPRLVWEGGKCRMGTLLDHPSLCLVGCPWSPHPLPDAPLFLFCISPLTWYTIYFPLIHGIQWKEGCACKEGGNPPNKFAGTEGPLLRRLGEHNCFSLMFARLASRFLGLQSYTEGGGISTRRKFSSKH